MKLVEVLSPHDSRALGNMSMNVVDSIEVAPYGLYLIRLSGGMEELYGSRYQIALNKNETSFTDIFSQKKKFVQKGETFNLQAISKMKAKIAQWISMYGDLLAGSYNPKKNRVYDKLLRKCGFAVSPHHNVLKVSKA